MVPFPTTKWTDQNPYVMLELADRYVRQGILGFGIVGLLTLLAEVAILPTIYDGLFSQGQYWIGYFVSVGAAITILSIGVWLKQSKIPSKRYQLIAAWGLVAMVGFGLLNIGFLSFTSFSFSAVGVWSWLRWAVLLGGAGGLVFGTIWVQSLERAVRAEKASVAAESYQRQRDELEILNQYLRHDIRNNLMVIDGYVGQLDSHIDETGEEYQSIVQENVTAAIELTKTARDLTEVLLEPDTGNTTVQLDEVLKPEIERARSKYPNAAIHLDDPIPEVTVSADELLGSVFRNLFTNAVEHNDTDKPRVAVSVELQSAQVVIRVTDNGPGIPDSRKGEIFDQGEKSLESEGTGLGLYLVKTLVNRYDGSVDVADADPTGSEFTVELPLRSQEHTD